MNVAFPLPPVETVADLALKGTLLLATAGIASLALRRAPASARHLAWAIAFAGMLALPALTLALPAWRIPILPAHAATSAGWPAAAPSPTPVVPAVRRNAGDAPAPAVAAPSSTGPATAVEAERGWRERMWLVAPLALLVWMLGAALAFVRLGVSVARVWREERAARPLAAGPAAETRDRLVWRLGIDRPVALLEGDAGSMPLTWGVRRPRVLVPAGTETWPADRLEAVLTHELAHVRRRDCAWQMVAEAACALHWFNPLAWAAARRLRLESEHACDDQVLLAGSRGADYAEHLLDVVRTLRPPRPASLAGVPMARPSQLRTRLHAVLSDRARGTVPLRIAAPALAGAAVLVALIAAVTPSRAGAAEVAVTPGRCAAPRGASSESDLDFGAEWRTAWNNGQGCGGRARIRGDVRFNAGFTAVEAISRGGSFTLELHDAGRRTRVEMRPAAGGGLSRTFRAGGREVPWGPAADAWLAAALPELMRRTTYAAEQRAGQMLAQGGPEAVLDEVKRVESPALGAEYLAALTGPGAEPRVVARALREVAALEDEPARVEMLLRAAALLPTDDAVHAAYLRAADGIRAEADLQRVLVAFAERGGLSRASWRELFRIAGRIRDDADAGALLQALAPALPEDAVVRAAYRVAAARIRVQERRAELDAMVEALEPASADTLPDEHVEGRGHTTTLFYDDDVDGARRVRTLLARDVLLTADRAGIERISEDGWVIFREDHGASARRVRIEQRNGELRYTWSGDFSRMDREAWLRRMLAHFTEATRPQRRW